MNEHVKEEEKMGDFLYENNDWNVKHYVKHQLLMSHAAFLWAEDFSPIYVAFLQHI